MKTRNACLWRACAMASLCGGPLLTASAAEPMALTLEDAIELASARNPDLAAFRPESEALRQQAAVNALRPAMTVELQLENFAGPGDASSEQALEATLQLSQLIELGGKADLRGRIGDSERAQLDAAQRAKRADVLAEIARRFVHLLTDQEQLAATQRATKLAQEVRNVVQERIRAGATSPVALNRAEIALARARISQEHVEHELASSRVALAALWGDDDARFSHVRGDLFTFPRIEPLDAYVVRLADNPELLLFASDARALDARMRLAEAQRQPNIIVSAGVRHLEALDDQAFVAGVTVPLGSARRAGRQILSLGAERERLTLSEASRRLELRATLFALYQEIKHRRTEADLLRNQIRPQAERMVQVTEEGYRAGRYSLLELADAQAQLLEIERDAISAASQFHSHLIEIERVTGVPVDTLAGR